MPADQFDNNVEPGAGIVDSSAWGEMPQQRLPFPVARFSTFGSELEMLLKKDITWVAFFSAALAGIAIRWYLFLSISKQLMEKEFF